MIFPVLSKQKNTVFINHMKKKVAEYLSEKEVAKLLELPEVTIQRWIHQGKIPSKIDHNKIILLKNDIINWAKTHDLSMKKNPEKGTTSQAEFTLSKAIEEGGVYNNIKGNNIYSVFENALEKISFINRKHKKGILDELINREEMASTAIGNGVAIPHTRNRVELDLKSAHIPVFFLEEPIFFNAIDNNPVSSLFILFTTNLKEHLKILSKLGFILRKKKILKILNDKNYDNNLIREIRAVENKQSN